MKRVILFLATNLAVILVLSVVLNIVMSALGVQYHSIGGYLVIAAVFGFGGSFISLLMSKWVAKRSTGARVIDQPRDQMEQWLVTTVARQAQQAGIKMPEVAIYDSPDMNAFATGPSKDNSLVAVSTGLLYKMDRDEVEAVLGHEVSHVANGDMVTMTLIQGVLNTFVIFFARVVAGIISNFFRGNDEEEGQGLGGLAYFAIVMVLEMVFGILASIIVAWFSRQREFRADAGGATLAGRQKMIGALERLGRAHEESHLEGQLAAFGIQGGKRTLGELLMSHPPIEKRIAALRAG
ncbi:MAG: protease HtpX [Pseudomonadota bacterium]|uniref:Protease HtpX n=1 Tax=Gallaecimonas pentaromativorans TaxID=584787 RepID=A0A3N1PHP5_9GAMM|nr:protease HtpX [Gallaecimonas pentaromativorans]MED5525363.1 protease HtpX [Pseudomonadota bacterium]ROQ27589.1 heat shock protein [Gallaecimonas pentaromativorans]